MDAYTIKQGNENELDLIQSLWEKLNRLHLELSPYFRKRFRDMSWETRKSKLIKKSGEILFEYVINKRDQTIIAYFISSMDKEDKKTGEIDSIFIEEPYRKSGIGTQLMENAI